MASDNLPGAGPAAGDILELLKRDHQRVEHLLDQIEETQDSEERRRSQLFAQVAAELEVHSDCEDQVVYGALEGREGLGDLVEDARQEHEHIEQALEELDELDVTADDWLGKVRELRQLVRHHVDEEEGPLFARMREQLGAAERSHMGNEFLAAKDAEEEEISGEITAPLPITAPPTASAAPSDVSPASAAAPSPSPDDDRERDIESLSKKELYELARTRHIEGRSAMTKAELVIAIRAAR